MLRACVGLVMRIYDSEKKTSVVFSCSSNELFVVTEFKNGGGKLSKICSKGLVSILGLYFFIFVFRLSLFLGSVLSVSILNDLTVNLILEHLLIMS